MMNMKKALSLLLALVLILGAVSFPAVAEELYLKTELICKDNGKMT